MRQPPAKRGRARCFLVEDLQSNARRPSLSRKPEFHRLAMKATHQILDRALAYADAMPPAISGEGGHAATFRVAIAAAHGFGLDEAGTLAVLERYNERCQPPWSPAELAHKVRSASAADPRRKRGYLLRDTSPARRPIRPRQFTSKQVRAPAAPAAEGATPLPELMRGTEKGIRAVARQTGLPDVAVKLARDAGVLRFALHRGAPAWFATDPARRVCQARRLDGRPWPHGGKADTVVAQPGAGRHLVGIHLLGSLPGAILCEGAPDLLACFALLVLDPPGLHGACAPLALFGAGVRFLPDEAAILAGRRVVIAYDADGAGQEGLIKRAEELAAVGSEPFRLGLPPGCGDLRDAVWAGHAGRLAEEIDGIFGKEETR